MSMHYDPRQREAVDSRHNVVVSAGAGAGKTSVLVGRYARLVTGDRIPVDRILTLTFTRKAAAEMHDRIYAELLARAAVDDDDFVRGQLHRFHSAVISTLDSFCGTVARSGCSAFGVPPTFTVDEKRLEELSADLALRFLLGARGRNGRVPDAIRSLVRLNRFGPLWHDGFERLARDHFLVSRELDVTGMATAQRTYLVAELERACGDLRGILREILLVEPVSSCIGKGQAIAESAQIEDLTGGGLAADVATDPGEVALDPALHARVTGALEQLGALSGIKKNCGSSRKPEVLVFKEHVDALGLCISKLSELLRSLQSWHEAAAAAAAAQEFQALVTAEKRRTAVLSHHDVLALAISVLERDAVLRDYYKRRFQAIMIDEFQDNNEEQKQLLYLLAERTDRSRPGIPGPDDLDSAKLFFVGDEKQSIYRFRGADVSVFKRLSDELGGDEASIVLDHNYRSEPGLVRFFNAFFGRIFAGAAADYEARFAAIGSREPSPGVVPSVQLWQMAKRDGDDDLMTEDEAEAFHIARYIGESVAKGTVLLPDVDSPSGLRPATFADFAILMRSTGNQMRIERMLRLMGIPYVSQTARSLFLEAPMNDIYSALELVLYPQDRVALAAYLRSPLVGMSDDGLVRVLSSGNGLSGGADGLTESDAKRLSLAVERHAELSDLADTSTLTELVHHIWFRWGYRYHLLRRDAYSAYLEHYDYIYELARLYEDRGLAAFLSAVRSGIGSNERTDELNVVRDESDGVHIMTIHKAKGLEFPVVIVANTGNRGRTDSISSAPFYRSPGHGIVFNVAAGDSASPRDRPANFIYRHEREEAQLQDVAEMRRLLYVAATRAETHLIFSGYHRANDASLLTMILGPFEEAAQELSEAPELSITSRVLDPVPADAIFRVRSSTGNRDISAIADRYAAGDRRVVERIFARREFTPTELNARWLEHASGTGAKVVPDEPKTEHDGGMELFIDTAAGAGLADSFGTFAHYCVERMGRGEATPQDLSNPAALPASIRPALSGTRLARFLAEGTQLAEQFLRSDLWRAREGNVEFEVPFLLSLSDPDATGPTKSVQRPAAGSPGGDRGVAGRGSHVRVRGKIDLVIDMPDRVLVVDFKTDRTLNVAHYAVQMELYRRAAAAIFGKPVEVVLVHLRTATPVPAAHPVDDVALANLIRAARSSHLEEHKSIGSPDIW